MTILDTPTFTPTTFATLVASIAHPDNVLSHHLTVWSERLALIQLVAEGDLPMSTLAARIGLSRAALTALVDRLETMELVTRFADAGDRRRTLLQVTDAGREMVAEGFAVTS